MNRLVGIVLAIYNFFAGDAIILGAVVVAFVVAPILAQSVHVANWLVVLVFVVCIVGGLALTLNRERIAHR